MKTHLEALMDTLAGRVSSAKDGSGDKAEYIQLVNFGVMGAMAEQSAIRNDLLEKQIQVQEKVLAALGTIIELAKTDIEQEVQEAVSAFRASQRKESH